MASRSGKGASAGFARLGGLLLAMLFLRGCTMPQPVFAQELGVDDYSMVTIYKAVAEDSLETLACLTGGEARDTVFVTGVFFNMVDSTRSKRRVRQAGDCPDNTVAAFHSHPWNGPSLSEGIDTPFDSCFLGPSDVHWLKELHKGRMAVVAVGNFDPNIILVCWFTSEQIEEGLGGRPWIQSMEGQRWIVEVTEEIDP